MYAMNQAAADKVKDIRRGLHVAMTALITDNDYAEAEFVLKQMDAAFSALVGDTRILVRRE